MRPISYDQALAIVSDAAVALGSEQVRLVDAARRVLSASVVATFDSPQSNVSMMDGYAVREANVGDSLDVIGVSAAGKRFDGNMLAGQAVRIFTGAAVPEGAERIVIQEYVRADGDRITILEPTQRALGEATWLIRCPAGQSARAKNELVSALAF